MKKLLKKILIFAAVACFVISPVKPALAAYAFQVDTAGTLTTSLNSYYKLDETSGTRVDVWAGNDLTDNNTVTSTTGKVNTAGFWTAANDESLTGATSSVNDVTTGDMSMAFWLKTPTSSASERIAGKRVLATGQGWYIITPGVTKVIQMDLADSSGTHFTGSVGTTVIIDDAWHLVILTWSNSGQRVRIYVDNGADESSIDAASGTVGSISTSAAGELFQMGRADQFVPYGGALDEFGFWTKVLSAQERTDLWNAGAGQTMVTGGPSAGKPRRQVIFEKMIDADRFRYYAWWSAALAGDRTINADDGAYPMPTNPQVVHARIVL